MALSNAERQARYRDRLKLLAARGSMSSFQAQMLADTRKVIRQWKHSLAMFSSGRMTISTNGVNTSPEHIAMLKAIISQNEKLLLEYDPDNFTADGNIELGDVAAQEVNTILLEGWVSFNLDEQGRAIALRSYRTESQARTDAQASGRDFGQIADDMWSILPHKFIAEQRRS